jgi:hypothetical protein
MHGNSTPMKRIPSQHYWSSPSVSLSRQDLDEILHVLTSACDTVGIRDNEFQYDSFEDMAEVQGSTVRRLVLEGFLPSITLTIQPRRFPGIFLISNDSPEAAAAFLQIRHILERCRHWLSYGPNGWTWSVFVPAFAGQRLFTDWPSSKTIYVAGVLVLIAGQWITFTARTGWLSRISLVRRPRHEAFWERHGEKILPAAILGAIAGAVLREVIVWARELLFP